MVIVHKPIGVELSKDAFLRIMTDNIDGWIGYAHKQAKGKWSYTATQYKDRDENAIFSLFDKNNEIVFLINDSFKSFDQGSALPYYNKCSDTEAKKGWFLLFHGGSLNFFTQFSYGGNTILSDPAIKGFYDKILSKCEIEDAVRIIDSLMDENDQKIDYQQNGYFVTISGIGVKRHGKWIEENGVYFTGLQWKVKEPLSSEEREKKTTFYSHTSTRSISRDKKTHITERGAKEVGTGDDGNILGIHFRGVTQAMKEFYSDVRLINSYICGVDDNSIAKKAGIPGIALISFIEYTQYFQGKRLVSTRYNPTIFELNSMLETLKNQYNGNEKIELSIVYYTFDSNGRKKSEIDHKIIIREGDDGTDQNKNILIGKIASEMTDFSEEKKKEWIDMMKDLPLADIREFAETFGIES